MKSCFATITTADYFHYVKTLYESIQQFDDTKEVHVLVVDADVKKGEMLAENLFLHDLSELKNTPYATDSIAKYTPTKDNLRWALKPVFTSFMLREICDKVVLLDNDIYFFHPYEFLFEDLDKHRVLLTPHWRCKNPHEDEWVFTNNFTDGVFNAGFFAADETALEIIDWWSMVCNYKCEKKYEKGFWDDQKYLDLLPSRFEGVGIVRHQGCNVASWNKRDSIRVKVGEEVLINGKYPIVFVHFTLDTMSDINRHIYGGDPLMKPYLEKYEAALTRNKKVSFRHA
jgi:hypothetical protein